MTPTHATPASIAGTPQPAAASRDEHFLSQVGQRLGIAPDVMQSASGGTPFVGPSGLLCRIHAERQGTAWLAHPEILLPLAAAELGGPEVARMLSLQAHLLMDFGWYLGLSDAGLLSLRPLARTDAPQQVADDLDRAHALARGVLEALVDDSTGPTPEQVLS